MKMRCAALARLTMPCLVIALAGCVPSATAGPTPTQATPATGVPSAAALKWPAPADPMGLAVKAGLVPEPKEQLAYHVHVHLDVFIDGQAVVVPAGIGINITDPDVHTFDDPGGVSYGGIQLCAQPCISPLHTHDVTGVIHTESATPVPNTLGQFFIQWGVPLSASCVGELCAPQKPVAFYVNGKAFTGDPNTIQLADRAEIAIVIGTPPPVIPAIGDFAGA